MPDALSLISQLQYRSLNFLPMDTAIDEQIES
jgi:hypothetical protein